MRLGKNLVVGLGNSAWIAVVSLAATPLYLRYLGIEAYGLIGFFTTLQATLSLLDLGLSPTMNREVARGIASGDPQGARRLLHSLSLFYWSVALVVALALLALAPWLADRWLQSVAIPRDAMVQALLLMGLAIAARWPVGLYLGALNGAQRVAQSSAISALYATVAALGAIGILAWVAPTIQAFFAWQALAAVAYVVSMRAAAWRSLGGRQGAGFDGREIRRVWQFSAGMGLISVTSVLFTQIDKVMLSRMLGLDDFGRYMLAALVSGGIYLLVTPVFNAVYPRFSALVANGESERLAALYRVGTRFLATLVFPAAMVVAFFAEPLLALWTGDVVLAAEAAPVVRLLTAGTALHAMMFFPYALQLASGLPRLSVTINIVMIVLLIPLMVTLTLRFAAIGAAAAWLSLHVFYLFFGTWVTHRRLLEGQGARWLAFDVGLPLAATLLVVAVAVAAGAAAATGRLAQGAWAAAMWASAIVLSIAISPDLRSTIRASLDRPRAETERSA